jgi:hypothetical protein
VSELQLRVFPFLAGPASVAQIFSAKTAAQITT